MFMKRARTVMTILALGIATVFVAADHADARRGGGFGSRGARTFQAPAPTPTAPRAAQPIERSMTPRAEQGAPSAARQPGTAAQRPGFFGNGFGGSMMRGLLVGGLIGMLLGHGLGGMAGAFGLIVQIALAIGAFMLVKRLLAGRSQPAPQPVGAGAGAGSSRSALDLSGMFGGGDTSATRDVGQAPPAQAMGPADQVGIKPADFDSFERLLTEVQEAFGREDYAALRERTTPEIMSYLAEELSQNATRGVTNRVGEVKLLQGDLSEAWREDGLDYATVHMRYESRDVMLDRAGGGVAEGSVDEVTETTEAWTFVRPRGGAWKVSAIQDV
jgi:predicted lipid-binding transport protein (Tim44 family)